jgi:hypothetical protein
MIGRRGFFTAIGAAVAAVKAAPLAEADGERLVISLDACILCGFDGGGQPNQIKPWGGDGQAMRCADAKSCQDRQVNALLGTRTLWQERTGTVMAKGKGLRKALRHILAVKAVLVECLPYLPPTVRAQAEMALRSSHYAEIDDNQWRLNTKVEPR